MNINYDSPFNFKPIPSITPASDYWQNGTWKFNMSEISAGATYQPSWIDIILHGVTALTLVNAKEGSLEYLSLFGDTEQLPETYLDTVTLSGGCEQRNLPSGYQQIAYLESDGTQYLQGNISGLTGNEVITIDVYSYNYVNDGGYFSLYNSTNNDRAFFCGYGFQNAIYGVSYPSNNYYTFSSAAVAGDHTVKRNADGSLLIDGVEPRQQTQTYTTTAFTNVNSFIVGKSGPTATTFINVRYKRITVEGKLDLIPCRRNSDSVLGMFDLVSQTFFTNAGSGSFTAGADVVVPSPTIPMDIVCNNGTIKVSPNLFNANVVLSGTMDTSGRDGSPNPARARLEYLYLPTGTYTISNNGNTVNQILGASYSDNTGSNFSSIDDWAWHNLPFTFTLTSNRYVRFMVRNSSDVELTTNNIGKFQIEQGSTATSYMPYGQIYTQGTVETVTDSNQLTASAERLLAVGDYKDTQEVLSGSVTRRIGIKVLDGTEEWAFLSTNNKVFTCILASPKPWMANSSAISTHFNCRFGIPNEPYNVVELVLHNTVGRVYIDYPLYENDLVGFKQWLADQYTNGNPVTIVYPLETATTESVSGQFLSKSPVTQTAGSISNLPIAITESQKTVPTPQQPLQINCNNGVVKVNRNLYSTEYHDKVLSQTDGVTATVVSGAKVNVSAMVNCTNVKSFMVTSADPKGSFRLFKYRPNGTFIDAQTTGVPIGQVLTLPSDCGYFRIQYNYTSDSAGTENILIYNSAYNLGIYVDGTTETVEITGKNLFNKNNLYTNHYINSSGAIISTTTWDVSAKIPVIPNAQYTLSGVIQVYNSIYHAFYDSNDQCLLTIATAVGTTVMTAPANASYLRLSIRKESGDKNTVQLEQGSTATTYENCYNGGTAIAENLFKVGTYQDVQSVLDGGVTRNVGIKVLDGTENWTASSFTAGKFFISTAVSDWNAIARDATGYCTHAVFNSSSTSDNGKVNFDLNSFCFYYSTSSTTLTEFKQFLVDQYNAGTPVIVVYPTSSPTTETVTAQPMNIQAGNNTVSIVQASMDDLELEVKYKAGVSVTITEIQNAQLDDNVEVTIQ